MTSSASTAGEQLLSGLLLRCRWRCCRRSLPFTPAIELGGLDHHGPKRHARVLQSAELGALAAKLAGPCRREGQRVGTSWNQILLAREVGNPQAVNHVLGAQLERH